MEKKTIIEVYKKRKYNEYLIEKREKLEKVENPFQKLANEYNEKLAELLKDENKSELIEVYSIKGTPITKDAQAQIDEIEKDFKDKMDDRNRLVEEVEAQLDLCETRDEMLETFKLYGIISENNKIYDYKN